ncbi:MAG: hypothetical protein WD534_12965 [Phycisphaeraceae bacterium]
MSQNDHILTVLADAVTSELNAASPGTFDLAFTAQRLYRPRYQVEDLAELRISVVPRGVTIEGATRSVDTHEMQVDVAVQQKLPAPDSEADAIDALMTLVQQIGDYLRRRRLDSIQDAVWTGIENNPVYAVDHLDELRVFTSVLTLTYRVLR